MKKLFSLCFAYCFMSTSFIDTSEQSFDAIINLGGDCQVAYQMQINGIRKYALPFDKLITPYASLHKLLENKFEGFMHPDNLELVITDKEKYILDKKYGTRLIHDFKLEEDFLKDYDSIKETYQRRIDRLFKVLKESKNPLVIRKIITKEQAVVLQNLLKHLRSGKPFILAALDGTEEMKTSWQLEDQEIQNFYLRQPAPYSWKGDNAAWKEIFVALGLPLAAAKDSTSEV